MNSISYMSSHIPDEARQLLQKASSLAPPNRCLLEVEPTLRKFSPLFLHAPPFSPEDRFLNKCLKTVVAVLGLFHYARSEVRALLEVHPFTSKAHTIINTKIQEIEEVMCRTHLTSLDNCFAFAYYSEKLMVINGEKVEIPKAELIRRFLDGFKEELGARQKIYLNGEKISLRNNETRQMLLEERENELNTLFERLKKTSGNTLEEVKKSKEEFEQLFEEQFEQTINLNYALSDISDVLSTPLQTLS